MADIRFDLCSLILFLAKIFTCSCHAQVTDIRCIRWRLVIAVVHVSPHIGHRKSPGETCPTSADRANGFQLSTLLICVYSGCVGRGRFRRAVSCLFDWWR